MGVKVRAWPRKRDVALPEGSDWQLQIGNLRFQIAPLIHHSHALGSNHKLQISNRKFAI